MHFIALCGLAISAFALCGACYSVMAAVFVARFRDKAQPAATYPAVTILKPLYGDEPGLDDNLASFCAQDYPAPVQIVFGVHAAADPTVATVERLRARYPALDIMLVADPRRHGANGKVSNLINMLPVARHDVLVISDSDILAPPDYLRTVIAALEQPGVGMVSCLYSGAALGGFAARLSAMGIDYQFLPNVLTGMALGMASPCFGSTMALHRGVLHGIGGFEAFSAVLADDYEIGRAVRARGLGVVIPRLVVRHTSNEKTIGEWLAHELRWARTIRGADPVGHAGSVVTYPIPLALLGAILSWFTVFSLATLITALAARTLLKGRIDRFVGDGAGPLWLLPVRDVLSFGVFLASLFGGSVEWRGERLLVKKRGALSRF